MHICIEYRDIKRCLCIYIYMVWLFQVLLRNVVPQLGTAFVGSLYEPISGAYGDYCDYG